MGPPPLRKSPTWLSSSTACQGSPRAGHDSLAGGEAGRRPSEEMLRRAGAPKLWICEEGQDSLPVQSPTFRSISPFQCPPRSHLGRWQPEPKPPTGAGRFSGPAPRGASGRLAQLPVCSAHLFLLPLGEVIVIPFGGHGFDCF